MTAPLTSLMPPAPRRTGFREGPRVVPGVLAMTSETPSRLPGGACHVRLRESVSVRVAAQPPQKTVWSHVAGVIGDPIIRMSLIDRIIFEDR